MRTLQTSLPSSALSSGTMRTTSGARGHVRCGIAARRETWRRRFSKQLLPWPQPTSKLQHDAVRIHEIDRPDDGAFVHCLAALARRAVVIDKCIRNALGGEPLAILVNLLRGHIEGNVVHRGVRSDDIPRIR